MTLHFASHSAFALVNSHERSAVRSGICTLFGMVFAAVLAGSLVSPAHAANINTNAVVCEGTNAADQGALGRGPDGVYNGAAAIHFALCTVPRSPLPSGATSGSFYVDGDNFNGQSTACILYSYQWTGQFLGSASFTSASSSYDVFLTLTAAQLGTYAYTSLLCQLPPTVNGLASAMLRGVTSLQ